MSGTALVPAPPLPPRTDLREAARVYAATQSRRTAPVAVPTKGRIVDLAG